MNRLLRNLGDQLDPAGAEAEYEDDPDRQAEPVVARFGVYV